MLISMNILKTVIRRTYVLTANGCGGDQCVCCLSMAAAAKSGRVGDVRKMFLQNFEDYVFQNIDKKFIATIDTDQKILEDLTVTTRLNATKTKSTFNKTPDVINATDYREEQNQQQCEEYEEAVRALNTLQSNAESLRSSLNPNTRLNSLKDTQRYLEKSGLTTKDLEKLSYIHVSGTKGKGSTCALTDSILRAYGVKTGFYSSPHLVSVTERIRINGQPISKKKFTEYFWPVYDKLKSSQEYEKDMPAYFKFLTILAFHIYLAEKVDVLILEVGIGGELDCTNVVPNTKTVGITSLGLEHTNLLGNTLKEIAWQKAGIIKPNSTVYTSVKQTECLEVIQQRATEKQAKVFRVPELEEYFKEPNLETVKRHLNNVTVLNGSLAIQLAYDWLRQNLNGFHRDYDINKPQLTKQAIKGIINCSWPGRCQKVKFFNFNIHLDGAHTVESMQVCGSWFQQITSTQTHVPKILVFNTTGERDSKKLLNILRSFATFDLVCFVPNIVSTTSISSNQDNTSVLYSHVEQLKRAQMHSKNWQELCQECHANNTGKVFLSTLQSFQHIRQVYNNKQELNILVTGSIHLIGAVILSLNELCKELTLSQA